MATNLHSPATDVFLYLDGYNALLNDVTSLESGPEALRVGVTGLGMNARRRAPTGMSDNAIAFEGTHYDDGTDRSRDMLEQLTTSPGATDRIFSMGVMGTTIGTTCEGYQGAIQGTYKMLADHEDLHRIAATFEVSGVREEGAVVLDLSTIGADGNSQSTSLDDLGSSSLGGLTGYLHVNSLDGDTGDQLTVVIQESSDNSTFATIVSFAATSTTSGPTGQRVNNESGGVERYLAEAHTFSDSGLGSADIFVMAART